MHQNGDMSEKERTQIAGDFILHAPPGEFNEVFNDVRLLLNSDQQLKEGCSWAFGQYNKEQFVPVRLEGAEKSTLITSFNDLGGGRFLDPRTGQSFLYDHLRKEASGVSRHEATDASVESWRKALEIQADGYIDSHYQVLDKTNQPTSTGVVAVFGSVDPEAKKSSLTLCIESHKFQPKNYSNGRWRSQWSVVLTDRQADLKGVIKVQVHYYEDGNVQLVSSKEINRKITVSDENTTVRNIIKAIEEEETSYQLAAKDRYDNMSKSTLKALRRQLPVTKTRMDWNKAIGQGRIANELRI